jgi:hypothetical protein
MNIKENSKSKIITYRLNSKMSARSYLSNKRNNIINSFILFGCWNDIDCSNKKHPIYRDIVIQEVNREQDKLVIVAGDNWYTNSYVYKNVNYKYYPFDILKSGYQLLLKNENKFYDIILGNHDEDIDGIDNKDAKVSKNIFDKSIDYNIDAYKMLKSENYIKIIKDDCMLKIQKYVIKNIVKKNYNFKVPLLEDLKNIDSDSFKVKNVALLTCIKNPHIKKLNEGVYIIYINTNLFDNYTYKSNNDKIANNISTNKMIAYIKRIQKLLNIYNPKLLFITGHNPLVAYKKAKFHKLNDIYKDEENCKVINNLISILNKYKTIYLCADVHNFNIAVINNNIGTVISGTGGASPDYEKYEGKLNYLISPNKNIINISEHYVYNAYGYTKIKYDSDFNVYVTYKQIFNAYTYKDRIYEKNFIEKPVKYYNFVFKNTENGWNLEKKPDKMSSRQVKLDMKYLLDKKKIFCDNTTSNSKDNITSLIKRNQLVYSKNVKYTYLKNDPNTPLLCYYKAKKNKKK